MCILGGGKGFLKGRRRNCITQPDPTPLCLSAKQNEANAFHNQSPPPARGPAREGVCGKNTSEKELQTPGTENKTTFLSEHTCKQTPHIRHKG